LPHPLGGALAGAESRRRARLLRPLLARRPAGLLLHREGPAPHLRAVPRPLGVPALPLRPDHAARLEDDAPHLPRERGRDRRRLPLGGTRRPRRDGHRGMARPHRLRRLERRAKDGASERRRRARAYARIPWRNFLRPTSTTRRGALGRPLYTTSSASASASIC